MPGTATAARCATTRTACRFITSFIAASAATTRRATHHALLALPCGSARTWVAERHAVRPPHTAEERYAAYRMLQDEYEQLCVEYVSDYYAERGEEWWPYK